MRSSTRLALLTLIVTALAGVSCNGSGSGGIGAVSCGGGQGAPAVAALSGTWQARFEMDSAERLPLETKAKTVEGRLSIDAVPPAPVDPATGAAPRAVMKGQFAIDFTPLGFTVAADNAIAWYSAAPTLSIVLNPDVNHGNVAITGIQNGDTIDGQWQLLGDPMQAAGRVVLTRSPAK
jgi:hypothetical protein